LRPFRQARTYMRAALVTTWATSASSLLVVLRPLRALLTQVRFPTTTTAFFREHGSIGGSNTRLNAALSTTNPGVELQTAFASLWDSVKGSPDTVLCDGYDRLQLSNALLNSPNNSG